MHTLLHTYIYVYTYIYALHKSLSLRVTLDRSAGSQISDSICWFSKGFSLIKTEFKSMLVA